MTKENKVVFGRLGLMRNDTLPKNKKIKIGFVGGGPSSFIGYTHRLAARFDNRFDFVAGVFSRDKKKSIDFGSSLGLDPSRCYANYSEMAKKESKRSDGIEALGIMTPSGDHYKIAKLFIENKIHIICDKPLTATVEDAIKLQKLVKKNKIVFALTHNYSAYPMLREAKNLVEKGKLGKVLLINVEYPQGYTVGIKKKDEKSILKWRLDNKMCGPSMILAEIGTHSYHLLRYVTNLEVKEISAEVNSLSPEISVDDNAFLILRMNNKARASIWVSSAATGGENGLKIRVYGNKGSVEWLQDEPNHLKFTELNQSTKIITRASNDVSDFSLKSSRLAAGHPEGFFEAFSNIYTEFADCILSNKKTNHTFPNIEDGVKGIKFIFAAKKSSNNNSKWEKI
ncbi:Gfo/Idh/MocA family oxidoreductase [Alphaproteobacteria bacterium]|nr:Gfo/Idh/MocA family oxidoreductase [Alphaproteobacteria bacterium]